MRQLILAGCLMGLSGYMTLFGAFLVTMGPPIETINALTFEDILSATTMFLGAFGLVASLFAAE